jgi:hypothetical protein
MFLLFLHDRTEENMEKDTELDFIDFEEEKAKLWKLAYSEIKRILLLKGLANQRVELPNNGLIQSVKLDLPDVIVLEDIYGRNDYAECFEDDYLFEVYNSLTFEF